jgi:hypothetical protein
VLDFGLAEPEDVVVIKEVVDVVGHVLREHMLQIRRLFIVNFERGLTECCINSGVFLKQFTLYFFLVPPVKWLAERFMKNFAVPSFNNSSFERSGHAPGSGP